MTESAATLHVVEPSKVRYQHIFVIDGYLRAMSAAILATSGWRLRFLGSASTIASLSSEAVQNCETRRIPVMDPEKKRLIRKCLLEFAVVVWCWLRLRPKDALVVTCMLSPSLMLLQLVSPLLPRRRVFVVLHGELEWLDPASTAPAGAATVGYWAKKWLKLRRPDSIIKLIVLDAFIRDQLLKDHAATFRADSIFAVRPPVIPLATVPEREGRAKACFIGYRTRFKSFDDFLACARTLPEWQFLAVGGGAELDVLSDTPKPLRSNAEYLGAIAACDVAVFPYDSGYTRSLSASGLDAMIAGVHIVALRRPFFLGLAEALGSEFVNICDSPEEIENYLRAIDIAKVRADRAARVVQVSHSPFGFASVAGSLSFLFTVSQTGCNVTPQEKGVVH